MTGIGTAAAQGVDPHAAYHSAGAFKLAHAVAMHGIALLPGLAWLSQLGSLPAERQQRLNLAAAGYFGMLASAMAVGPALVWVLGAACAAVLVAAGTQVLLAVLRAPVAGPAAAVG